MAGTRTRPRGRSPGQHARPWASKRRLLQPPSCTASGGPDFRGVTAPNGIHRWSRIRGVRNHLISTQASGSGLGAARGSTPRFGTQNSLPCIAWRSWRRGRCAPDFKPLPSKLDGARGRGSGGRSAGGRHTDQASGLPGAACAPLGEQAPPLTACFRFISGRVVEYGMSDQHLEKRQVLTPCTNTHTHTHGGAQVPSFEITHTHTHSEGGGRQGRCGGVAHIR